MGANWPPGICARIDLPKALIEQKFWAMLSVSKLLVIFKGPRIKHAIGQAYERFLELPLVLVVLWFVGLVILGSLGLVLYVCGASLVRVLTGGKSGRTRGLRGQPKF